MRINLFQLIKSCGTQIVPAAKTKSIGLQADALACPERSEGATQLNRRAVRLSNN
jgi:hypothetical protein